MSGGTSSARPARLVRFGETTDAMDEGLRRRFGALDEALAAYRATCDAAYRFVPTTDTAEVLRTWSSQLEELGRWTAEVGRGFIASQAIELYKRGFGTFDPEDVLTLPDESIIPYLADEYQDDPFLGVPAGGWQVDEPEIDLENPDALAQLLEDLGLVVGVSDATLKGFNDLLASTPRSVTVRVRITETHVLFLADGRVLARVTRAEATARLLFPGRVPSELVTTSRWLGRVAPALDFAGGAYEQWQNDAGLDLGDRLLRAGTRGGATALGGLGGGWAGGMAGGAAAGLVCGPGAPVCSTVLAVGGGIVGGLLGGTLGNKLSGLLPWMDDPPEPKPGEHDLDAIRDELAQADAQLSEGASQLDAASRLVARDLALAETADRPDLQAALEPLLPDRDELWREVQGLPHPDEVTTTGTTTTTTVPSPTPGPPPPSPSQVPAPSPSPPPATPPQPSPGPAPTPTPTPTTVPQG